MASRGPRHSAPYGQACVHCFKAKCRCVARPDGASCERCYRLKKQCSPSDSMRRQNAQKAQNSDAKIAHLEGRIDSLVSVLQSIAQSSNTPAIPHDMLEQEKDASNHPVQPRKSWLDTALLTPITFSDTIESPNATAATREIPMPTSPPTATSPAPLSINLDNIVAPTSVPGEVDLEEAQAHLDLFRSRMLPFCPFVHLPPELGVRQLQDTRPFFFRSIIAVTSLSTQKKMAHAKSIKQIVAQNVVVENQSSMDLLLGLLTFTAWSHDQFLTRSGTLSRLITLALSIAYDLRLNKPLPSDAHMIAPLTPDFEHCRENRRVEAGQRSLEQQRAVLGCFILSSFISAYFAQTDAMRWTPAMDVYLRTISASKECPTDEALAFQVRLQLLAQEAIHVRDQLEAHKDSTPAMPASLLIKSLQAQLQEIKSSLSREIPTPEVLDAHMHYLELCINTAVHPVNSDTPSLQPSTTSNISDTHGHDRIVCLWRSLESIKSWFDIFFTMSPDKTVGLPFQFAAQLARCIVVLYRLSTLSDSAWDRQAVRNEIDLLDVLEKIAEKLESTSKEIGEQSQDDQCWRFARMMRSVRAWVAPKLSFDVLENETSRPLHRATSSAGDDMMDQDQSINEFLDFGDNRWLEEMFGGFG